MTKKLLLTFALLLTAVTGAWANEYLYFEVSGTSATMKYGEDFWGKPYYDERADWWINDSSWDGRENIKTITVDASCQNINQENLSELFNGFTNLETITNIDKLNTANVQDMSRLFNGCTSLTTLDLSGWNTSEVTDMSSMFNGCTSLTTLNIIGWDTSNVTNTVSMFSGCTRLASISFPASLTTIGDDAFQGCTDLATVTVYATDCTLGDNAFEGCSNLTNIYVFSDLISQYQTNWNAYADKITAMTPVASGECGKDNPGDVTWRLEGEAGHYRLIISGMGAMADYASSSDQPWKDYRSSIKTVVIGAGVTSIGNYAFYYCTGLTSIEIPASVTTIGGYAFRSCSNLATVTFAESSQLTSIGTSAFANTGLTSIEIPASVTSIGNSAFNNTGLTSINIPASVTSIGNGAFINCSNLEAMTVDGENAVYDSRDNCNAIIEKSSNTLIAGCKNTTIPDDVTSIGDYAFNGCTGLTSIEIPASVTSIGDYAFKGCTGLTSIEIPAGVTSIGVSAFEGCSGLTSIEIPAGVTRIGVSTFQGCSGLTSIVIPAGVTRIGGTVFKNCSDLATVTVYAPSCTLGNNAFVGCNNLTNIYVLSNYVGTYKCKNNWKDYADKISVMFDGTSTTTMNIPEDVEVNSVLYNRTFTEGKPSTVMLPFSLSSGQTLTGGTLYKFTGVTKNETTGKWEATMTETTTLQANTPYLLLPDENLVDGKVTFNLNNSTVTLNTKGGGNRVTADQGSHWTFKGTYEYMKWTTDTSDPDYNADRAEEIGKAYGFAGVAKDDINVGDFVKVASGAKIRPMGCYLVWNDEPNASRAAARGAATEELPQSITVRLVSADGEVTGIGEIDTKTGEMTFDSEAWYTLNGVRLSGKPTKKGLYINNGRKVVVK